VAVVAENVAVVDVAAVAAAVAVVVVVVVVHYKPEVAD
jgi:hypothetical protein